MELKILSNTAEMGAFDALNRVLVSLDAHRRSGKVIVSTNGCFDVLHAGHVRLLEQAKTLGDVLVVGINDDISVRLLKGPNRPRISSNDRAEILHSLRAVDHVVVFEGLLPLDFLEAVKPNIHCKGGDYGVNGLPETEVVRRYGGEVRILPFLEGRASTAIIGASEATSNIDPLTHRILSDFLSCSTLVRTSGYALSAIIASEVQRMACILQSGGRILICGNGGSACDAEHMAGELVGRFRRVRDGLPAIALTGTTAVLTSIANDFGFEEVFRRQLVAHARPGDLLLCFSTSGNSENIVRALKEARALGIATTLITGREGGRAKAEADVVLAVPASGTIEIQHIHRAIMHALCEGMDEILSGAIN